jgi:hypothetical protein
MLRNYETEITITMCALAALLYLMLLAVLT